MRATGNKGFVVKNCDPSLGVSSAYVESNASLLTCKHVISFISYFIHFNVQYITILQDEGKEPSPSKSITKVIL